MIPTGNFTLKQVAEFVSIDL